MRPTLSPDNNKRTCTSIISASCVLWHGPDLNCIETCAGDSMVDVIAKTSEKLCSIEASLDLTGMDLSCLDDSCTGCNLCSPTDKVLKNVLECLITKFCALKTTVEALPSGGGTSGECEAVFTFDPTCVSTLAGRTLSTPTTNSAIVQLIADAVCISYQELSSRIDQLNIDLIACCNGGGSGTGTIPQVNSSCLFLGLKDIDEAFLLLDDDYCDLKAVIGSYSSLTTSLNPSGGCSTQINTFLGTTIGAATTLHASLTNIYSVLCALSDELETVKAAQAECCKFSCDSIALEVFGEVTDVDAKLATLVVTFNGATNVPAGITDNGTKVTFTDKNGTFITYTIDITDSLTYTDLALTGLDMSGNIQLTVDVKYEYTDPLGTVYNCNKCVSGTIIINNACAVCDLTVAGGTSVNVKVTYEYDGDVNIIIISSNGVFYIPKGATITSIVDESGISPTITSACTGLVIPAPATLACWRFAIPEHLFQNGTLADGENEQTDWLITGIIVNNIRYTLGGSTPAHFGVKGTDECADCVAFGTLLAAQAYTSLALPYAAGGVSYVTSAPMTSWVATLNGSLGTNPYIKSFTSACTNSCGDNCMSYRFLHSETYTTTAPLLEITLAEGNITTVAQIKAEEITGLATCKCNGEIVDL